MAKRIQRKRTKGWRMPEGAVYVGRPTKWGNPFWHPERFHGLELSLALYADMARGFWNPSLVDGIPRANGIYEDRCKWLARMKGHPTDVARNELVGRDLVCWCAVDAPCHADVLLEIANRVPVDAEANAK